MGSMKDLLGDTPVDYPSAPGWKEPTTSRDAAVAVKGQASKLRTDTLRTIAAAGAYGLTADEVASALDQSVLAIRPRVSELSADNQIEETGQRRKNISGLNAKVWRIKGALP